MSHPLMHKLTLYALLLSGVLLLLLKPLIWHHTKNNMAGVQTILDQI